MKRLAATLCLALAVLLGASGCNTLQKFERFCSYSQKGTPPKSPAEKEIAGLESALPPCPGSYNSDWHNCFGIYTWAGGANYVGEWKGGEKHGQGTYFVAEVGGGFDRREDYVGESRNNKYHGQGTLTWLNSRKYVGEFSNGESHGPGIHTSANCQIKKGIWKDGKFQKPG